VSTLTKKSKLQANISAEHIKYVDAPGYQSFYSNNVAYGVNATDFVLIFGEIMDITNGRATVERRARITMSPIQAKALINILSAQIRVYEEKSQTTIQLPPGYQI
jgi:hypothetical protein